MPRGENHPKGKHNVEKFFASVEMYIIFSVLRIEFVLLSLTDSRLAKRLIIRAPTGKSSTCYGLAS